MHIVTFVESDHTRIGILDTQQNEIIDLARVAPDLPQNMLDFIARGDIALVEAKSALRNKQYRLPVAQVQLLAPIPRPLRNIICIGKNYRDHVREVQSAGSACGDNTDDLPAKPIIFTKATTSVIGTGEDIPAWLDSTHSTDYEGELAVIIGKQGRSIPQDKAFEHIYGYTILNDVTSRRLQREHQQWFLGKSLDGYCPMGPAIVTADEISDVTQLRVQTWINDELRQDDIVAGLIFDIPTLIETLSRTMTLEPGDIIATGTPAGVGMGFKPPRFLQKGDVVKIRIDPIGTLENPVA
jgi:2-keto-4-pentenoate hydratase/2-oxohepta-3-ene-1,7-dioic acid hydratase in catechol pathway